MFQVSPTTRILVAVEPVDFRAGIDGMARLCRQARKEDPITGTLFVFRNRRQTGIRLLGYDGQGFWLMYKRFSCGHFSYWPSSQLDPVARLRTFELTVLLAGGNPTAFSAHADWRPIHPV